MTYNLSLMQNGTTILKLFEATNSYTDDSIGLMMILALFFIMIFALKRYDFSAALLASSWTCFILSALLTYAELLNFRIVLLFLAITGFISLYVFTIGGREG